jgi:hypothetical protein
VALLVEASPMCNLDAGHWWPIQGRPSPNHKQRHSNARMEYVEQEVFLIHVVDAAVIGKQPLPRPRVYKDKGIARLGSRFPPAVKQFCGRKLGFPFKFLGTAPYGKICDRILKMTRSLKKPKMQVRDKVLHPSSSDLRHCG